MASGQVCPVIGSTTTALPPNHPSYNVNDPEARCPVTNAKVGHHGGNVIHSHPSSPTVPRDRKQSMDANACPAMKSVNTADSITHATCPVVGRVSGVLPAEHPKLGDESAGKVCPVTNATLEHHKDKVHPHPSVPADAPVQKCPVAGHLLNA